MELYAHCMELKICMPLAFLADFVIIEVDFFEGFTSGCVAEGARYGAGHSGCFFSLECRGQARGMWNLVMQHARHPSTGVVFLFFKVGSAIAYVCTICLSDC